MVFSLVDARFEWRSLKPLNWMFILYNNKNVLRTFLAQHKRRNMTIISFPLVPDDPSTDKLTTQQFDPHYLSTQQSVSCDDSPW
jgi:hypothetical protein